MTTVYSPWDGTLQGSTEVVDEPKEYLVRYTVEGGDTFQVKFRVKPNPIGFIWRK